MKSEAPAPVANRGWITVSIMLATFMQGVDTTIANVALPHMQGSMSASQDQIAWVVTSYIVAAAIMTPLTGWLARPLRRQIRIPDFGRRLHPGLGLVRRRDEPRPAGDLPPAARHLRRGAGAAVASGAAADQPAGRHARAMAVWGMGVILGPIIGPALGGWLTDNYSWRWVFYINVPFGVLAALGILIFIRETRHGRREAFDWFGFATLSLAIGALQMLLDRGELKDWFGSTEIWIEATIAGLAFYLFVVHTATATDRSFLNRDLLKDANCMVGTMMMFLVGIPLYGTMTLLPTMLQDLMNYPVVTTGLVTAPRGVGTMVAMILVARLAGRIDTRLIIMAGLVMTAASMWQMTGFSLYMGMGPIISTGVLQGFGLGFVFTPLSIITFSTLPRHDADPRHGDFQPDAQYRRQHRHLDRRGAADPEHPDRPFAPGRASAAGQPAGPRTASGGALQPDRPVRRRRAQCRGDAPSGDGRLYRRLHADDDPGRRRGAAAAAAAPAASLRARRRPCLD